MQMIHERSPDTDAVVNALRGINDEVSYRDLAHRANLSLGRTKEVLASARRILVNENGILFGCMRGIGLKRMSDTDKVKKPASFRKRVFRGAGREIKHLATIADYENLTKSDQNIVSIERISLNAIRQQASVKPQEKKVATAPSPLPNIQNLVDLKKKA